MIGRVERYDAMSIHFYRIIDFYTGVDPEFAAIRASVTETINYSQTVNRGLLSILKRMVESDFENQYKFQVITLFTLLEASIKDYLVNLILWYEKNIVAIAEVSKIKVSVSDFIGSGEMEITEAIFSEYEQKHGVGFKYGVDRFERLLSPFGMSHKVKSEIKRDIDELTQIRNCLIHRDSIVDRKLLEDCPWLFQEYRLGERIRISAEKINRYAEAAHDYCKILANRHEENREKVFKKLLIEF